MNASLRPWLLAALSMLTAGCSLARASTSIEGPSFVLTAEEPVAAFEVTLCLKGPTAKELYVSGSLSAEARTTAGPATLRIESLADRTTDEGDEGDEGSDTLEVSAAGAELPYFSLLADGPWKDGGRRCATPEVLEFAAEGLAPGESLEVESWVVSMDAEWQDGAFGDGPGDGDVSVEIERL